MGKVFTIGYLTTGIGLFVTVATLIAQRLLTAAAARAAGAPREGAPGDA